MLTDTDNVCFFVTFLEVSQRAVEEQLKPFLFTTRTVIHLTTAQCQPLHMRI